MLHFVPAYGLISPCLKRPGPDVWLRPANDNAAVPSAMDPVLDAALRLFAVHGLSAAAHACDLATEAGLAGDFAKADWWIEICRTLDRTMARDYRRKHGGTHRLG